VVLGPTVVRSTVVLVLGLHGSGGRSAQEPYRGECRDYPAGRRPLPQVRSRQRAGKGTKTALASSPVVIVDVWMQHPTLRFIGHDMFESLRRWTGQVPEEPPPIDATVGAMDGAGVDFGLLSAWSAPRQPPLISNEVVAEW